MKFRRTMSRLGPVGVGVATLTVLSMTTGAVVYAASSTAPPLILCVDKRANVTAPSSGACPSGASKKEVATQAGLDEALAALAAQARENRELKTVVAGVLGSITVRTFAAGTVDGATFWRFEASGEGLQPGATMTSRFNTPGGVGENSAGEVNTDGTYSFLSPGYGCGVTDLYVTGAGLFDTTETSNIIPRGAGCS